MEYKKNNTRNQPNSSGTSHYTESNAGHLAVKTTSPFLNKIKDSEYSVSEQCKGKKNSSGSVLNKKLPRDIASGTSKMLINQILGDSIDKDDIINLNKSHTENNLNRIEKQCNYNKNILISNVELKSSTPTLNSKSFSMRHGSSTGEDSVGPSRNSIANQKTRGCFQMNYAAYSRTNFKDKKCADKTTYCRPAINRDLGFVTRTVERNNRLQRLVKQLVDVRKKEKQTEAWNNYINELKNKHGYGDNERNGFDDRYLFEESTPPEYIDDYYNTQCTPKPSNACKELLRDFYDAYNTINPNTNPFRCHVDYRNQRSVAANPGSFFNYSNCYPISSQGRLTMVNRQKYMKSYATPMPTPANNWLHRPAKRPYYGNTIYVDKEPTRSRSNSSKAQSRKTQDRKCKCCSAQTCSSTQTEQKPESSKDSVSVEKKDDEQSNEEQPQEDEYSKVSENVDRLKNEMDKCKTDTGCMHQALLQSLENKLDSLVISINAMMDEVKSRNRVKQCYNCHSVSVNPLNFKNNLGVSRSDTFGLIKAEKFVCGLLPEAQISAIMMKKQLFHESQETDINKILVEEINNSTRAKEDIENMLSGNVGNCSVQISIDIPTKDRCTEVTKSLSKGILKQKEKSVSIEEIQNLRGPSRGHRNMTIAVNTDPLGLLALLKVSTEAVKQLLSYMPSIPYHNYLSMVNFPQGRESFPYVCNICGAAFGRPSQLSDHIGSHNLGNTRDCCVCRHVLDIQRNYSPGLFRCQYCGQRFTRAYCCELHQESCAKRLGRTHDVTPSLILLR